MNAGCDLFAQDGAECGNKLRARLFETPHGITVPPTDVKIRAHEQCPSLMHVTLPVPLAVEVLSFLGSNDDRPKVRQAERLCRVDPGHTTDARQKGEQALACNVERRCA